MYDDVIEEFFKTCNMAGAIGHVWKPGSCMIQHGLISCYASSPGAARAGDWGLLIDNIVMRKIQGLAPEVFQVVQLARVMAQKTGSLWSYNIEYRSVLQGSDGSGWMAEVEALKSLQTVQGMIELNPALRDDIVDLLRRQRDPRGQAEIERAIKVDF